MGEVITAKSIVERIDEEFPEWEIFISATTNTGFSVAERNFLRQKRFLFPFRLKLDNKKSHSNKKAKRYYPSRT